MLPMQQVPINQVNGYIFLVKKTNPKSPGALGSAKTEISGCCKGNTLKPANRLGG